MRVSDLIQKMVVFIGHKGIKSDSIVQLDGTHDFGADGTGFIFVLEAYGQSFPYIVTAKHVIDQAAGEDGIAREIYIRVNLSAGGVTYIKTNQNQWVSHPDHIETGRKRKYIDIAVFPLVNYRKWEHVDYRKWDFTFLLEEDICTEEIIGRYDIGLGDELAIPGLFLSHIGVERNMPVIRIGTISAMRGEPVPTSYGPMDAYLVEMRSVGGISGSPAIINMAVRPRMLHPGTDIEKTLENPPQHYFLLGLVHGHYTITDQGDWVFKTNQQVGDINAGIAVIVPISMVMETILPSLGEEAEMAKRYQDAENLRVKTVADSAPTAEIDVTLVRGDLKTAAPHEIHKGPR